MGTEDLLNAWTAWSSSLGEYTLKCVVHEEPRDTHTVVVTENDKELERVVVVQKGAEDWEAPHKVTEILRLRYLPKFIAHVRAMN